MKIGRVISRTELIRRASQILDIAVLVASLATVTSANAVTLDVPRLPAPAFADREASGDTAISESAFRDLRRFRLDLTCDATSSNNVQVAFGRDAAPFDGKLAAEETAFIIGWDSGEWFLRPAGLKVRHAFIPSDAQTSRRRKLNALIRVNIAGTPASVTFSDDAGTFIFDGLARAPPSSWLAAKDWNLLRVTVRGADMAAENVEARFLPDGAIIILR